MTKAKFSTGGILADVFRTQEFVEQMMTIYGVGPGVVVDLLTQVCIDQGQPLDAGFLEVEELLKKGKKGG